MNAPAVPVPAGARTFAGSCHCGAIAFAIETAQSPESWPIRACRCGFCRRHGARTFADPAGRVAIRIRDESLVERYRFALGTAEFLVCRRCGVYLAAVLATARGRFATININTIEPPLASEPPAPVSYEGESAEQRRQRREDRWTPIVDAI